MAKYPKYEADCAAGRCYNGRTQQVNKVTQYVVLNGKPMYVCGGCAAKLGREHGILTPRQKQAEADRQQKQREREERWERVGREIAGDTAP